MGQAVVRRTGVMAFCKTCFGGHGAPVRLLAPGRRGPWWVKWVRSVDLVDRPWWLQLPFPLD
jgi:hypothetical protein